MRKIICIVTVCFMIITVFSGCTVLQKLGLQGNKNDELHPVSSIVMNEDEAKKLSDKVPIHLYFANTENSKLKLEVRYIPITEAKKSVSNLATAIVKELIKGPGPTSMLKPTVPAGAQLRSPVSINAGIATVDFTKDLITKHPGGKTAEQLTIFSIVNSLTELKEVQKVKFTINGKPQKEFKGSFQFDAPFPRSTAIISKEVAPVNAATTDTSKDKAKDTKAKEPAKDTTKDKAKDTKTNDPNKKPSTTPKQDNTKQDNTKKDNTKKDGKAIGSNGEEDIKVNQDVTSTEDASEATYLDTLE